MVAHSLFLLLLEATVSYCTDYPGYVMLHWNDKVKSTLHLQKHERIQLGLCA